MTFTRLSDTPGVAMPAYGFYDYAVQSQFSLS